jgi:DNA-directed RNA polymerase subunit alpha
MNSIALSQKITFVKGDKPNQGSVVVEPCYPGYGITLGNALRRVLLSSLPGAAVIGVKIKGADHEFQALPHVKEDVLEIILNLKRLRLKVYSDEPVRAELEAHGEKKVKASDIEKSSGMEIVNPDLEIAHITDMAGNLKMEIFAANGRGYETVESREKKNKEIGYIEIDSAFSPVMTVAIRVDNVRVGKMTNWDKLTLEIETDGTIEVSEAFEKSVKILIEQFDALISKGSEEILDQSVANQETAEQDIEPSEIENEETGAGEEKKKKKEKEKKEKKTKK